MFESSVGCSTIQLCDKLFRKAVFGLRSRKWMNEAAMDKLLFIKRMSQETFSLFCTRLKYYLFKREIN